ncbi:E3 ubiquitin-protein ligase RGLG5 [Juglans microcarpa x Juglans regia]|uniref:E3 ubiquitin-protein ligase RGLG5 n=1 Tax=Juglans microcarpa x Juglans regia TaxID=2249226 RepID=UPI001B7F0BF7|nr:E3 ubiquitin-protein ligase RGLG5 [Juglans microcarpa x Juglans regia]XP_041011185.1 E3 ubiquitin-protein ligase RGLG5 [Juglans microcarpa x Juglans regia]XP_041011186.1 E3 ubiquitin-protein ligase RGLG5 [Juglans microcarpa x Juglans regia]XP_041011187.1 E3 ubiquitin-protein ligase RGLG5 [Juglans microcarpa x Juglans regia]XP_041011188.1 E3 ubiquitin-protein ligase RGLG5 [Juglans microcarpa x Juglans regia]XP_041011189.1 E3 ubiquitin-protein ligase RGLG5 [Juglans microcarpa x Juglans regia]
MGGKSSKGSGRRGVASYGSGGSGGSSTWNQYGYAQPSYPQQNPYYTPQHPHAPPPSTSFNYGSQPSFNYGSEVPQPQRTLDRRYSKIADNYRSLDEVTAALAHAGLESSNLIVGIDFTKSNEWTGARSFNRRSLHHIGNGQNPYQRAISIIGKTLSAFDEDNLIPCFGFGDASTHDQNVFSFYPEERHCNGFEEVLTRYREIVPELKLAGPTSFAPIIEMAITIVEQSVGQYHVLLIIADGQVTRSVDTQSGQLSPQEQKTINAIVKASEYPLSIILVGVGDGPWDMMREFDDNIPARAFDNFQFVNFTEIMSKNVDPSRKETEFALAALMEIPSQYKATIELGILGRQRGNSPDRVPLPPPLYGAVSSSLKPQHSSSSPYGGYDPSYTGYDAAVGTGYDAAVGTGYDAPVSTAPSSSSLYDNLVCPICLTNRKDMAFGCGHQTCCECGEDLEVCPICRRAIETRIRLY